MTDTTAQRIEREARLRWVPLHSMKVSPLAQRELNEAWVDKLASEMRLEDLGYPTVSLRDGIHYIIDGQHRVEALRKLGFGNEKIECWTYVGLTEEQEADKFLVLNNKLTIATMDRFLVAVTAGREIESDIERIVRAHGLTISNQRTPGSIAAVGTLRRIYTRGGHRVLARTLEIVWPAYGDPGLVAPVLDGIALVCQRFDGQLNVDYTVGKLANAAGGANALLNRAERERSRTGTSLAHCVAAMAVETINTGKGGKKLPSWWKS